MSLKDLRKGDSRPMPPSGVNPDYYELNGWVAKELADLHPTAATAFDLTWDDSSPKAVYAAGRRFYCAAVISVVFRALDDGVRPSLTYIAELLTADGITPPRNGQPFDLSSLRRLLKRYGLYDDFLAYRTADNPAFLRWIEDGNTRLSWCRMSPRHIDH